MTALIAFLAVFAGIGMGWCLRVGMERGNERVRRDEWRAGYVSGYRTGYRWAMARVERERVGTGDVA